MLRLLWVLLLLGLAQALAQTPCPALCDQAILGMQRQPSQPEDPTYLFNLNQTCIAQKSCTYRAQLDNPLWLERVIYRFIGEYLAQTGGWPRIIQDCHWGIFWPEALCADAMARYHIEVDLLMVLEGEGCGSDHDWYLIGEYILQCLREVGGWVNQIAEGIIPFYRYQTRTNCLNYRFSQGLPLYGNEP